MQHHPTLSGYNINHEIGSGGMARVFDATQISLDRPVAIKFLSADLYAHSEARELFEKESLIIAQLNHPNIVHVIDKGLSEESIPYFVMEKIDGVDLEELIDGAQISFDKKMDIAIQTCKGLDFAHKSGIIHRDIKPSNIIMSQHGIAKILDFGIALVQESTQANAKSSDNNQPTSIVGSQGFVAPEQIDDFAKATIASDIFSFGIVLQRLFCLNSDIDEGLMDSPTLEDLNQSKIAAFKRLPEALQKIINQCIELKPDDRFQSLTDVRNKLLELSQGSHIAKNSLDQASEDTKDLSNQFKILDVLASDSQKRVYLFQKITNAQLLVIKKRNKYEANLKVTKILKSLKHPNIVKIYATATTDEYNIVVSEYLPGGSLTPRLVAPLPLEQVLSLSIQICSALTFAHNNKILHTRLTPENLIFSNDHTIKLTDFSMNNNHYEVSKEQLCYLPPGNQLVSERFDLYSLGAIMHHMLYGMPVLSQKIKKRDQLPFKLEKLIDSLVSIDPVNRPENAQVVLGILKKLDSKDKKKRKNNNLTLQHEEELTSKGNGQIKKENSGDNNNQENKNRLLIPLIISLTVIIALVIKIIY